MRSNIISDMLKNIPLETRVRVTIEAYFIANFGGTFFMPLDDEGEPLPEAVEANEKCFNMSHELVKLVLDEIKEWKEQLKEVGL